MAFPGLQYSYLNNDSKSKGDDANSTDASSKDAQAASQSSTTKPARSEITLDELSDLYRNEEEEELRNERRKATSASTTNVSSSANAVSVVQLRASRDDLSGKGHGQQISGGVRQKKINRLSCKLEPGYPGLGLNLDPDQQPWVRFSAFPISQFLLTALLRTGA